MAQMRDLTPEILQFRGCVTKVWNECFANKTSDDQHYYWANACVELFRALVLYPIEKEEHELFADQHDNLRKPLPFLHVQPLNNSRIMINDACDKMFGTWCFEDPAYVSAGDAELHFIWFFDWDIFSKRNFEYVMVAIKSSKKYPEAAGRAALIRTDEVKFLFDAP